MRALLLIVLMALPLASADLGSGPITFEEHVVPQITSAPEPTIGIPWNTDSVFYHSHATTMRGDFSGDEPVWEDVTPPYQVPLNLDPLLVADEDTGRVFAGGLHGACSVMMYSDDDGDTWLPGLNMCSGAHFDHQSLGVGPKPLVGNPDKIPQLNNAYYCGQLNLIGCAVSLDGGETWTAASPHVTGSCGGFHGHWRISRVTANAFLPVGDCGDEHGMIVADLLGQDGTGGMGVTGLTFSSVTIPGSHQWTAGFDPSIGISRDNGWMYYGEADHHGAHVALTKDEGETWESLPGRNGAGTTWVDVGAFADPPVVAATFADVQAGDDDRAAFTFMGIEYEAGMDLDYVQSDMIFSCGDRQQELVWHYYAAFTYDAGENWTVTKLTDDPVQVGGVYDSLGGHQGGCRNLLDFNDMDIDSQGRVHIGWADGCVDECAETGQIETSGWKSQAPRLLRQTGGMSLFSSVDVQLNGTDTDGDGIIDSEDDDIDGDGIPNDEDPDADGDGIIDNPADVPEDADSPGLGVVVVLALLFALRRR